MWSTFYAQRVNSTYQQYFEKRYKPLLDKILSILSANAYPQVVEEGCGIASIGKFLRKHDVKYNGYDIDRTMIYLAEENIALINPYQLYQDNILNPERHRSSKALRITHGVLEHFTNFKLRCIFRRYKEREIKSIHYVPLNKYKVPSFGDERLLPPQHWIGLAEEFGKVEFEVFNDGFDLWFSIEIDK